MVGLFNCPICEKKITDPILMAQTGERLVTCDTCGKYLIDEFLFSKLTLHPEYKDKRYILSGYCRETSRNGKVTSLSDDTIENILAAAIVPRNPLEAIDRILLYLFSNTISADHFITFSDDTDYPLAYAKNSGEFIFYRQTAIDLKLIEWEHSGGEAAYRLTIPGWNRIDELKRRTIQSDRAFVAMWFNEEVNLAWEDGFKPAISDSGYSPYRIDMDEHNEKIDDKIITEIRRSGLLVADFTGQRGGVYFEAGFALGLGIPVIWTCRKDQLDDVHFDTRQYNFIDWEDPGDLRERLFNRISATIPLIGLRAEAPDALTAGGE